MRIWAAECHSKFSFSIPISASSLQTLGQWVMNTKEDSTKTLRRWRATSKASGAPAWWKTSAGNSCVTSRRQNTPDHLRKHTSNCLQYYELCTLHLPSIFILSMFFIYPALSVISCCNCWNKHVCTLYILKWDYLKARKLEVIEQNCLWIWIQHTQISKKRLFTFLPQTKNIFL